MATYIVLNIVNYAAYIVFNIVAACLFSGFGRLTLTAKGILVFPHDVLSPLKMEKSCLMRVVCHTQNETFRVCYRQIQEVECAAHKIIFSECATDKFPNSYISLV